MIETVELATVRHDGGYVGGKARMWAAAAVTVVLPSSIQWFGVGDFIGNCKVVMLRKCAQQAKKRHSMCYRPWYFPRSLNADACW